MPLDPAALRDNLEATFAEPDGTAAGCADQWAAAMQAYAAGITPPSLAVNAAAEDLGAALATAFAKPSAIPDMEQAFTAFAAQVGLGMAPAYTGAPPAGPVGFAPQFAGAAPATHAAAASAIASRIDTWMRTGSATLVAPPNTVQPWS